MMLTKEQAREMFPEMAEIVDQVRADGGTITAAWIEDEDNIVIAGKRPPGEHRWADLEHLPSVVQAAVDVPKKVAAAPKKKRAVAIRGR